ncbi:hypothetical protein EAO76_24525 [Streptomyces sp. sk2.1]|nr:hypothetical protein EAO76_24525 [Streptomyces sp. sk2.1]
MADPWQAVVEGRRHGARGGARKREAGAGAPHRLVFVDRLVATLIHPRHDLPHAALGLLFGVDRSTITRAIAEIRGLLAERGCAVPDRPGLRLRTLADVFAYARAEGIELRLDATEVQVRRPPAGRGGRRAFVPGKKKQNTMKATVVADHQGRTLWTGATPDDVDRFWQAFLRRFDLEHTLRFAKQTLGWTTPKLRTPEAADRWTWILIVAHTQLRLARPLATDLRRPREKPTASSRLTPARVRRGFRNIRAHLACPARVPKPRGAGPGRPPGAKNRHRAPRYDVGKTAKRPETLKAIGKPGRSW